MKTQKGARHPKRRNKKLNKKELVEVKALSELGNSAYAIEKRTGISHTTIGKYLADNEAYNNPKIKELVEKVKENEIADLIVLNVQAKQRLHDRAPFMNAIEAIALMDRSFQQLRLLEGKSTQNIKTLTQIIMEADGVIVQKAAAKDMDEADVLPKRK